jgi:hypothetical protein
VQAKLAEVYASGKVSQGELDSMVRAPRAGQPGPSLAISVARVLCACVATRRTPQRRAPALTRALRARACQVMQKLLGSREEVGIEALNQLLLARTTTAHAAPLAALSFALR